MNNPFTRGSSLEKSLDSAENLRQDPEIFSAGAKRMGNLRGTSLDEIETDSDYAGNSSTTNTEGGSLDCLKIDFSRTSDLGFESFCVCEANWRDKPTMMVDKSLSSYQKA